MSTILLSDTNNLIITKNCSMIIAMQKIILITLLTTIISYAQFSLDFEGGIVFSGYNNVQIPRSTGTRFSLTNQIKTDPALFFRSRINYTLNKKHTFSLLYAPLNLSGSGVINNTIIFEGVTFPAYETLQSTYKFNSYRITYRYDFLNKEKVKFGLGFTAKIRDAAIKLQSSNTSSVKTNIGFVPIINFNFEYYPIKQITLLINGDALAAPQGRAEDVVIALKYHLSKHFDFKLGYRILEGGADVEEVYNFSMFHYALAGLLINF